MFFKKLGNTLLLYRLKFDDEINLKPDEKNESYSFLKILYTEY